MAVERKRSNLQTYHALQASDLAGAMNDAFQKVRVPPGDYRPELTAPEGPSTGGGVQAMQHLRLVPGQAGEPTLVVGHANHAEGKAELRNYECLDAIHRERFHRPLELERPAYDAFLSFAQQVFGALQLETTVVGPPADMPVETAAMTPTRRPSTKTIAVALIAALCIVLAFAAWALAGRG